MQNLKHLPMNLSAFCSQDIYRHELQTPWHFHGYTYATDGRVAVRIPTEEPDSPLKLIMPGQEKVKDRPSHSIESLFNSMRYRQQEEVFPPAIPEAPAKPCTSCKGNGYSRRCEECHGSGEVICPTCGHEHECRDCNGMGRVLTSSQSGMPCPDCAGTGKHIPARVVKIGCGWVNESLLMRFLLLPAVRFFQPQHPTSQESGEPYYITFTGGEGVLMPRRGPTADEKPTAIQ